MRRTITAAALGGLILLAGCDDQTDPSPPPTAEDALTTVTAAPVTDDVDETTEAAPATQEPIEPAVTTEAPAADGPPEMPAAAEEQTEEGAEAFALHYIDMVNYTGISPEVGLLEPLALETCQSCANTADSVAYGVENGDYLMQDTFEPSTAETLLTADTARISVPVRQIPQSYFRDGESIDRSLDEQNATLVIRLDWVGEWQISEITVEQ